MIKEITISLVIFDQDFGELKQCILSIAKNVEYIKKRRNINRPITYIIQNDDNPNIGKGLDRLQSLIENDLEIISIKGHGNIGFGSGHNLVIGKKLGEFHLIINADVLISDDTLFCCIEWLKMNEQSALVTPTGYNKNGSNVYLSKRYPSLICLLTRGLGLTNLSATLKEINKKYCYEERYPLAEPMDIEIASGCFMLIRSHIFRKIGGFDESFFLYFEDFDLSIRARSEGTIVQLPNSIIHDGGNTAKKGIQHITYFIKSALIFYKKHGIKFF